MERYKKQKFGVGYSHAEAPSLTSSDLQIIQLVPNLQTGEFFVWIVVEGKMRKVTLTIPRVFYLKGPTPADIPENIQKIVGDINIPVLPEDITGKFVKKTLPHRRGSCDLVEVEIREDQFKSVSERLAPLVGLKYEGVYETKVPLEFKGICQLGCVCEATKQPDAQGRWSLGELQRKDPTNYLKERITFIYLYHSFSSTHAIYVLYKPSCLRVVLVNASWIEDLSRSAIDKLYWEVCQATSLDSSAAWRDTTIEVDNVGHANEGAKILQRAISEFVYSRQEHVEPTIALIQCPDFDSTKQCIRALDEIPCVRMPFNSRDNDYQVDSWQRPAIKVGIQRFAASFKWLETRICLSRFAQVPLGNFEHDWIMLTTDVAVSRALLQKQQVLWVSDNGFPDLGGINDGGTCFADEVDQPRVVCPGAYRKISVELKIGRLAVNAIMKSDLNKMKEGMNSGENAGLHEAIDCTIAFQVLKQWIQTLLEDAKNDFTTSANDHFGNSILQHLYRWFSSPKSKFHDPALHRMLHMAMKNVWELLLGEFKKLGANIIFADFSKVIADTQTFDITAAEDFCDRLRKVVDRKRDFVGCIVLEPLHYWHSLLFLDQYNYEGILVKDGGTISVSEWNIADFLPQKSQEVFNTIISHFTTDPWRFAKDQRAKRPPMEDDILESKMIGHLEENIEGKYTEILQHHVYDLRMRMENRQGVLDFIDRVFTALYVDKNEKVADAVRGVRSSLLTLIRAKDFAPDAFWEDPRWDSSWSFVLPNVICSYCNGCRDLHLLQKSAVLMEQWRCEDIECGQAYDREEMEAILLQILTQRERVYHLQEPVCTRCNRVKLDREEGCTYCIGTTFECKEDRSTFLKKVKIFLEIAQHQKFTLLEECASWILQGF